MYSLLLLVAAALAVPVILQGLRAWRRTRAAILLFVVLALAGAALEAGLAGAGRWLGAGDRLRDLQAFPQLISLFVLPMTLFTFATLARRVGFRWAQLDWGHGAVCIFAVVLLLGGLPGLLGLKMIFPACWQDVVWYVPDVPPPLRCPGDVPALAGDIPGRWVARVTEASVLVAWLGLGAGLWVRRRWPWLLAGMVPGAGLAALPWSGGPLPGLLGPLVAQAAMVLATVHVLARYPGPAAAGGSNPDHQSDDQSAEPVREDRPGP